MIENLQEIKNCTIEKIIFTSEDGYLVAAVRSDDNSFTATFHGS